MLLLWLFLAIYTQPLLKEALMPAVTVFYPAGLFDVTDKVRFKRTVKASTAKHMDAVNPETGEVTEYGNNPDDFIDLFMVPVDHDDHDATTLCMATIVTYNWPDRVANMAARLEAIANEVAKYVPRHNDDDPRDRISFTFLGKEAGCWYAVH
jgi:hypothetical protein